MKGKLTNSLVFITTLLGMLASSPALGSHLGSSSTHSGPPSIHQPQRVPPSVHTTPISLPSSVTKSVSRPLPTLALPKKNSIPEKTKKIKTVPKAHAKQGWRLLLKGQTQAALSAYRKALRQNPQSAKAFLGLGISLKSLGKVEMAKKALSKAVDLDSRLPSALVHLGYLYADGHFGQAEVETAHRLFREASQLGDPFATIALRDMKSRSKP